MPPPDDLVFTPEVERSTAAVYERLRDVIPEIEWPVHAPYIAAINRLKVERRAVILAHNYQTPEIFHGVADLTGDSLALAREAAQTDADTIVLCGVHFMAETAKLLNPGKTVLIPDPAAGCSLADSITAEDVRRLRQRYPGVPVVTYVNTSAAVKAESDLCCTSANAVAGGRIAGRRPRHPAAGRVPGPLRRRPDPGGGDSLAGALRGARALLGARSARVTAGNSADLVILAHPECPPDVLAEADFVGSTAGMIRHVGRHRPPRVVLVTECSMSDNVAVEFPGIQFVRPCNLCPHMKRITLPKILNSLLNEEHVVQVQDVVAESAARGARRAVQRMHRSSPATGR